MTHAEVYAADFCSVYHADEPFKYSGLQRKTVDRLEKLIHPELQ